MEIMELARMWHLKRRMGRKNGSNSFVPLVETLRLAIGGCPSFLKLVVSGLFAVWLLILALSFLVNPEGDVFRHAVRIPGYAALALLLFVAIRRLNSFEDTRACVLYRLTIASEMAQFLSEVGYSSNSDIDRLHAEALIVLKRTTGKNWIERYLPVLVASVVSPIGAMITGLSNGIDGSLEALLLPLMYGLLICLSIVAFEFVSQMIQDYRPYSRSEVQRFYDDLTSLMLHKDKIYDELNKC